MKKTSKKNIKKAITKRGKKKEDPAITKLRRDVLKHIKSLRLPAKDGDAPDKILIRHSHSHQRQEMTNQEWSAIGRHAGHLIQYFANGCEIEPEKIKPKLIPVESDQWTGHLFRFATLLWSVPVSHGYGRRMRFLVQDENNGKLIGIFALGDPVFNLNCRDQWIGWNVNDRRERLVNLMDAYVVGAVPPYNEILGGKLVASLIGSAEVSKAFWDKYGTRKGIISGEKKGARLLLVTVTSALGRSSLYNRLKLKDERGKLLVEMVRIGETRGYGHFQLSNGLFERFREILANEGHEYANGHQFGQGPNWRFRVLRVGLKRLGLDEELIRHGIHREVFAMPLSKNFKEYLCDGVTEPQGRRPSVARISTAALQRWVIPRSERFPGYADFRREMLLERMHLQGEKSILNGALQLPLISES